MAKKQIPVLEKYPSYTVFRNEGYSTEKQNHREKGLKWFLCFGKHGCDLSILGILFCFVFSLPFNLNKTTWTRNYKMPNDQQWNKA